MNDSAPEQPGPDGFAALIAPKKDLVPLALKGAAIGLAEAIPGVSGGTVALILGVYRRLIESIKAYTPSSVIALLKALPKVTAEPRAFGDAARRLHADFLIALFIGMVPALLIGTKVLPRLIETHRSLMHALFFGMILASCWVPYSLIAKKTAATFVYIALGTVAAYVLVGFSFAVEPSLPFTFFSGAIAVCALILPGVSGSYLLHALGQYTHVSGALHALDLVTLIAFGSGMVVGMVIFVRVLSWLLVRAEAATLAVLTGLMIGSLRSVWFFQQQTGRFILTSKGEQKPIYENIWPEAFGGAELGAFAVLLVGVAIVIGLIVADKKLAPKEL